MIQYIIHRFDPICSTSKGIDKLMWVIMVLYRIVNAWNEPLIRVPDKKRGSTFQQLLVVTCGVWLPYICFRLLAVKPSISSINNDFCTFFLWFLNDKFEFKYYFVIKIYWYGKLILNRKNSRKMGSCPRMLAKVRSC